MNGQMKLLDIAPAPVKMPTKRKLKQAQQPQPITENINQTLARFSREAAENRVQLRKEGRIS